ncbi:uncharacterized protein LOC110019760 [Phalaenopsis equestris]|uniref:uncharacterized protein LOC110019760 n=1 Tax=Phalaenopsis equestris TaxID=78828 RepID=UPI0009E65A45|nr:uncharacterized protein LOC110019760 [Phalaenopsis equestris]
MATAGDGSENRTAREPAAANGIPEEAKRLLEHAIGEAISFKQTLSAAADDAVVTVRSGLSQILSTTSDSLHEAQGMLKLVKSEYTAYEDLAVEKIKEGIYVAASHPGISFAVAGGVGLVVLKRPRSFIIRNTRRLFLSEESMLAGAESKVNDLRQSINLVKNESRKLGERALKAEEEMERGRKALIDEGRGIQTELHFIRKIEKDVMGLKDLIHELPRREASRYRSAVSNFVSQVKQEKKALSNTASKIVNYGIPI